MVWIFFLEAPRMLRVGREGKSSIFEEPVAAFMVRCDLRDLGKCPHLEFYPQRDLQGPLPKYKN